MKLFTDDIETQIKEKWDIRDRGPREHDFFEGCNWWTLSYKLMSCSIYFDPSDCLGVVGQPYYEIYDGEDTERFLMDGYKDLLDYLKEQTKAHDIDLIENPENWL